MVIIAPILAMLSRMAGKLLNTIFGWATVTLFGESPKAGRSSSPSLPWAQ